MVLLNRVKIHASENTTGIVEQNDIGLRLMDRIGIERDQTAGDSYRSEGPRARRTAVAMPDEAR